MRRKHRVLFFKPILNWILGHLYLIILFILIIVVLLLSPILKNYIINFLSNHKITLPSFVQDILTELIVASISLCLTGIFYLVKGNFKKSKLIKRNLYNTCMYLYKNICIPKILKKIIAYLVNLFYFYNRELIQKQQYIVDDILNSLDNPPTLFRKVYWIQGSPYSGKTTTVLNLLIDLISKREYNQLFQKLDGNIIYFDLGKTNISLENLQRDYEAEKFSNCLIIFDNLHKLSGKACFLILEKIVLQNHAFALIVLLRHPEEFLTENDKVNDLKKIILENGREYMLSTLGSHDFKINQEDQFITFCQKFFSLEQVANNDEIAIHLYMLYLKKDFDSFKLLLEIQLFLKCNNNYKSSISSELLAIIACSLFTGSFNIELLLKCLPQCSETKWRKLLDSLTQIGFLTNYPNSHEDFYFHERIAKTYFKVSIKEITYKEIYINLFNLLEQYFMFDYNPILNFLYCMLAQNNIKAKKAFEYIVTNVNFLNLYEEMMFLFEQDICNITSYYKEIGILCDRCGKLQKARKFYSLYLDSEKNADAFYKLVQIDHKIIEKYPEIRLSALNSSDKYIKYLSNYWQIHINMHRGLFEFKNLFNLAFEVQKNEELIIGSHPYDGLHLIRRIYFDLFRLYYLEGIFQPEMLNVFTDRNSKIYALLERKLDEFEAYYIKFAVGLMLGQDILFSLAFEKTGFELERYRFLFHNYLKIDHSKTFDLKIIAEETISIYLQAIELFDKIGDKTAIFVKYHMYNIKLLLIENGDFSECERFYEDYMTFATRENILEYQAYAETFKLKMSLIQLCSPAIIASYGADQYDELKNTIQQKLELAQKYEELAAPEFGNQYAQLRLSLYETLFSFFTKKISLKKFEKEIRNIKERAKNKRYNRELKIIKYIENYNYQLSPESIRIIFSFYPIVPQ